MRPIPIIAVTAADVVESTKSRTAEIGMKPPFIWGFDC
jgi:hypothetical protein